jgi:uncharacterized protein
VSLPALYEVEVGHRRSERIERSFTHRMYLWLVDLDDLPRLPRPLGALARFDAADHLGDPAGSLRSNLEDFLATRGVDLRGGRITMLAHARVLGYVFNPLTLFWCHDPSGALVCVVAEVHNTYGGRHHYLLDVDEGGRATVDKDFYVSPFLAVSGEYRMRVPEPGATLSTTVVLRQDGRTPFAATMRGTRRPAGVRGVLAAAARHPFVTGTVSALIRRHGIALWLRRIPVVPRPRSGVKIGG